MTWVGSTEYPWGSRTSWRPAKALPPPRAWSSTRRGEQERTRRSCGGSANAGAVIVGKTTTMEFAAGLPEASKPFPVPVNPWRDDHWPGGSSSGTGSGVASGFFLAGLGSDTGGSIRIPAALCGVSGLMPTYGRVPKNGCVPLAFSLDHLGPLARSAWDCGAVLEAIAGYDPLDPDCSERPVDDYLVHIDEGVEGLKVGVARGHHLGETPPEVVLAFEAAVAAARPSWEQRSVR